MAEQRISPPEWTHNPDLNHIFAALDHNARLVGGCVRDAVLGRQVKDIDICTPLRPERVMQLLGNANIHYITPGLEHGTVTAICNKKTYEITTLRRDLETDGRHAKVEFTDRWEEDAARRDFTMNALSMTLDGTIFDYFDGIKDAKKGVVRFVGKPQARVQEDYLRILRYFRFEAHYGTRKLDQNSLEACAAYAEHIHTLSGERIQQEMYKLLAAEDPHYMLYIMKERGILPHVITGLSPDWHYGPVQRLVAIEKEEGGFAAERDKLLRLALLLHEKQQIDVLAERWKLSKKDKAILKILVVECEDLTPGKTEHELKQILRKFGAPMFRNLVAKCWAQDEEHVGAYKKMLALADTWQIPEFPLLGKDVMALGVPEGKQVGELLKRAEAYWESLDYVPGKQALLRYIDEVK